MRLGKWRNRRQESGDFWPDPQRLATGPAAQELQKQLLTLAAILYHACAGYTGRTCVYIKYRATRQRHDKGVPGRTMTRGPRSAKTG